MKLKFILFVLFAFISVKMQAQCSAAFTYSASPNGTVTFTSTGSNSMFTYYTWSFGNGSAGSGATVSAVYNAPGTYTVCLYVNDSIGGCTDTTCQNITVSASPSCQANFSYICNVNGTASLSNTGTVGNTISYTWYDNSGIFATGPNATYTNTPGTHQVCLAISDTSLSCVDTICQNISLVAANNCQANFYIYPDSSAPHTYIGVNTTIGNSSMNYTWTWGDGSSSTGQFPTHTYAAAGNYTICLYISDPTNNCSDSLCVLSTINKTAAMYSITFANPTGLGSVAKERANLYPNPVNDQFMVKGEGSQSIQVDILSLNGSKVKSFNTQYNQTMNISSLPSNLYVVRVINNNGQVQYSRLIKE
ncbi:MAG: PKD domain-containing protein [Chitinophagaceae bacterium]|nr:PKD domain-containing protein [Chitinophagaceae bacterium]